MVAGYSLEGLWSSAERVLLAIAPKVLDVAQYQLKEQPLPARAWPRQFPCMDFLIDIV